MIKRDILTLIPRVATYFLAAAFFRPQIQAERRAQPLGWARREAQ